MYGCIHSDLIITYVYEVQDTFTKLWKNALIIKKNTVNKIFASYFILKENTKFHRNNNIPSIIEHM